MRKISLVLLLAIFILPIALDVRADDDTNRLLNKRYIGNDVVKNMILPVVRLFSGERVNGTAFLIDHKGQKFAVTARHCVFKEEEWEAEKITNPNLTRENFAQKSTSPSIEVVLGSLRQRFKATVKFVHPDQDIAVLKVNPADDSFLPGDRKNQQLITLNTVVVASDKTFNGLKALDKVYVVGFPMGVENAKISDGILFPEDNGHFGSSAPITFGNSGSPIFHADTLEVIGVVVYLYVGSEQMNHINGTVPIKYLKEAIVAGKLDN